MVEPAANFEYALNRPAWVRCRMDCPKISVIVPVHNLASSLKATLQALSIQSMAPEAWEIVFVDDASSDASAQIISDWQAPCRVEMVRHSVNRGRAAARNSGWQAASGNAFVFLDGDMLAMPDLVQAYADRFAENEIDVVSGNRLHLDLTGPVEGMGERLAAVAGGSSDVILGGEPASALDRLAKMGEPGQWPGPVARLIESDVRKVIRELPNSPARAFAFITSNVAVRRQTLERTDGFYPFLKRAEDNELGLQLATLGARFDMAEAATAVHPFHGMGNAGADYAQDFRATIMRHPYRLVALAHHMGRVASGYCSAASDERLGSLYGLARAEAEGAFDNLDVVGLLEADGVWRIPGQFDTTRKDMVAYLSHVAFRSAAEADALIERALRDGVLTRPSRRGPLFNIGLLRMWLTRTTLLREEEYRLQFARPRFHRLAAATGALPSIRWEGTYRITVPGGTLRRAKGEIIANLPLPVTNSAQTSVEISDWQPAALVNAKRDGMILGFPLEPDAGPCELGYTFAATVSERQGAEPDPDCAGEALDDVALDRWLGGDFAPAGMIRLDTTLQRLAIPLGATACEAARTIYDYLLHFSYRQAPISNLEVLDNGFGSCIQLARLFINLCRLAGVPARGRCAACTVRAAGERVLTHEVFTPFAHTFAEFFDDQQRGWVPVEFFGQTHGARTLSPLNFADADLRRDFVKDGPVYDSYYFGRVDPFRIHCSPQAGLVPTLAVRRDGSWRTLATGTTVHHTLSLEPVEETWPDDG